VINYLMSKGLKKHILGTVCQPAKLKEQSRENFKPGSITPLTDNELEKHKEDEDAYKQKQVAIQEVIYQTVNKSTFLQIKNKTDAAAVWKKVISIHG
jgi:hypothetical protein